MVDPAAAVPGMCVARGCRGVHAEGGSWQRHLPLPAGATLRRGTRADGYGGRGINHQGGTSGALPCCWSRCPCLLVILTLLAAALPAAARAQTPRRAARRRHRRGRLAHRDRPPTSTAASIRTAPRRATTSSTAPPPASGLVTAGELTPARAPTRSPSRARSPASRATRPTTTGSWPPRAPCPSSGADRTFRTAQPAGPPPARQGPPAPREVQLAQRAADHPRSTPTRRRRPCASSTGARPATARTPATIDAGKDRRHTSRSRWRSTGCGRTRATTSARSPPTPPAPRAASTARS